MSTDIEQWLAELRELNPETDDEIKDSTSLKLVDELAAMDLKDRKFYARMTPEQKKEFSPWVMMRYMSSTKSNTENSLIIANVVVNHNFSLLNHHKELQYLLLTVCGTGRKQYHEWIPPGKGAKKNKLEQAVLNVYPNLRDSDLELFLKLNTEEELKKFLKDNGMSDAELKELFKKGSKSKS